MAYYYKWGYVDFVEQGYTNFADSTVLSLVIC